MQMLRITCLVLAGAVLTTACGDSKSSLNPTAPSGVSASSLHADAGGEGATSSATAKGGNGNGKGNGNGNNGSNNGKGGPPSLPGTDGGPGNTSPGNTSPGAPGQQKVEIEGLVTSVGSDSLTVNGQTVLVTSDTVIRHGDVQFTLAQLSEGDRVHVRATRVQASGADLGAPAVETLQATEIKLQNPAGGDEGEEPIGADKPGSDTGGGVTTTGS